MGVLLTLEATFNMIFMWKNKRRYSSHRCVLTFTGDKKDAWVLCNTLQGRGGQKKGKKS